MPVWMEQDLDKGRAALAKLGPTKAQRLAKARTDRERGLIEAVEILFGDGDKKARDFAYSAAMERLHRAFPQDVDIASLYALSLLGLAHDGRDYRLYMRSAGVLERYFPSHQRHPGVVHYLIHSYDDPTHAPLGLRAARLYGALAPDSHHAHHMTSHIFLALGDWASTIKSNQAALAVAHRDRRAEGKPVSTCGHYAEWMQYAHFQVGERAKADEILAGCRDAALSELAENKPEGQWMLARSYLGMWTRTIAETGSLPASPALTVDPARMPVTSFNLRYGELLLARGKPGQVSKARQKLKEAAARLPLKELHPQAAKWTEIVLLQADGLGAIAAGRREAGLAALRKAAEIEASMPVEFGPPVIDKPSYELLGEELLAAGRSRDAAEAFRQALKLAPGRQQSTVALAKLEARQPGSVSTAAVTSHTH